jgi:hypothetical protein
VKLYDENASSTGSRHTENSLWELAASGKLATWRYRIKASDVGTRTGDRNQMSISSADHELIVFREIAPTFRVKIKVDRFSNDRAGKPMFDDSVPEFQALLVRKATLTTSKGPLPFSGKTCDVVITPDGRGKTNCLVQITCGSKTVFGGDLGAGHEDCGLENGAPVDVVDSQPTPDDGDPLLTLDTRTKTMVLSDVIGAINYSASFTLTE